MYNRKYRFDIQQNTEDWEIIRYGKFTASICNDLLMDKANKGYKNLISRIAEERITGEKCENIQFKGNWATSRGHELEPIARIDYELRTLNVVKTVGVVELNDWVLCSPDGLIDDDKLHQIKCPIFSTQKEYLTLLTNNKNPIPKNYYNQLQFELFVTGRSINVFTCYHPKLRAFDIEVQRDDNLIALIETRLIEARTEVLNEIKYIKNL